MTTQTLTAFERRLLNRIQDGLPITARPFASIAAELGVTEDRIIAGLESLKRKGIVRRIGGIFSSADMGFVTTLVAAKVRKECVRQVAHFVNNFQEVTHNYLRQGELNLWFTLTATSRKRIRTILNAVRKQPGVERLLELPALQHYKVEVKFSF